MIVTMMMMGRWKLKMKSRSESDFLFPDSGKTTITLFILCSFF